VVIALGAIAVALYGWVRDYRSLPQPYAFVGGFYHLLVFQPVSQLYSYWRGAGFARFGAGLMTLVSFLIPLIVLCYFCLREKAGAFGPKVLGSALLFVLLPAVFGIGYRIYQFVTT
jgi:hypothetical protein